MENGEHSRPYFGLPAVGQYRNYGAANCLGIRVEWKHHTQPRWFTAPLQLSLHEHGQMARALLRGDATRLTRRYQEATALIQMLRGQDSPNATDGFWRSLGFRGSRPVIQHLETDHLNQTIRWVSPPISYHAASPIKATTEENMSWLLDHRRKLSPHMVIGTRPEVGGAAWALDKRSMSSSGRHGVSLVGIPCDTCVILRSRNPYGLQTCGYDSESGTCTTCRALKRCCTFTPLTGILTGWLGREPTPGLQEGKHLPYYGAGPMRCLVPHLGMPLDVSWKVTEIPEPFGWDSLYCQVDAGELDPEADGDDIEDGDDSEDGDDEGA
ncbi:hypothetical protein B0I37DRAFT_235730 [Chaetomium sp. MPI-CAGE-AT-0009]|nr:hypothetical protein B0I37DRAFT_235730 [Chaetomium sp. MPI-CAGE-AT-0009]